MKIITVVSTLLTLSFSASAQETELDNYHPGCAVDILSNTSEYSDSQQLQAWSKNHLLDKTVYCDEYTATDLEPGGVRTRLRNRYNFFNNNISIATIDTDGINMTRSTGYSYATDPEDRIIALKDFWYRPAIKTDSGYIFDQGSGYASCCYTLTEEPLRSIADSPPCIDNDGDGWGWDGVGSCRTDVPDTSGTCDYTQASLHDGYGWNQATGQSCPPTEQTTTDSCDYRLAASQEGWGWNAATGESCLPTPESLAIYTDSTGECDYQDARRNNGWGYNRVTGASCEPLD